MAYSLLLTSVLFFVISDSTANQRGYGLWGTGMQSSGQFTNHLSQVSEKSTIIVAFVLAFY